MAWGRRSLNMATWLLSLMSCFRPMVFLPGNVIIVCLRGTIRWTQLRVILWDGGCSLWNCEEHKDRSKTEECVQTGRGWRDSLTQVSQVESWTRKKKGVGTAAEIWLGCPGTQKRNVSKLEGLERLTCLQVHRWNPGPEKKVLGQLLKSDWGLWIGVSMSVSWQEGLYGNRVRASHACPSQWIQWVCYF